MRLDERLLGLLFFSLHVIFPTFSSLLIFIRFCNVKDAVQTVRLEWGVYGFTVTLGRREAVIQGSSG